MPSTFRVTSLLDAGRGPLHAAAERAVDVTSSRSAMGPMGVSPSIVALEAQPALTVVAVRWQGTVHQPTSLVVKFNLPVDPVPAGTSSNYGLVLMGQVKGRINPIRSARYHPASLSVTLRPKLRINPKAAYMLTVVGDPPWGIRTSSGIFLSGAAGTGTDFIETITPASI